MAAHIPTLNAGSSSVKFALFAAQNETCLATGLIEGLGSRATIAIRSGEGKPFALPPIDAADGPQDHAGALRTVLAFVGRQFPEARIAAVGHRVVHGGSTFDRPVTISADILQRLADLTPLAPLHQPHNLAGIAAATATFPDIPQIACFDTAFHRGHPFLHDTYALPRAFYEEGVRRYGFHGLSYEYIAGRLAEIAPDSASGKVIMCHLGNGASLCAMENGRSVSSTMGFSPLDGLPMGTRTGQLDPAVVLYLMDQKGLSARAISDLLYRDSGLKGLSGISNDMRELAASSDPRAREAIDYFTSRIRREIGGLAAVLEGLDAIVFSGGIGENAAAIRADILDRMGWLGIAIDHARNQQASEIISAASSSVPVYVIRTNEELMIARHAIALLGTAAAA